MIEACVLASPYLAALAIKLAALPYDATHEAFFRLMNDPQILLEFRECGLLK